MWCKYLRWFIDGSHSGLYTQRNIFVWLIATIHNPYTLVTGPAPVVQQPVRHGWVLKHYVVHMAICLQRPKTLFRRCQNLKGELNRRCKLAWKPHTCAKIFFFCSLHLVPSHWPVCWGWRHWADTWYIYRWATVGVLYTQAWSCMKCSPDSQTFPWQTDWIHMCCTYLMTVIEFLKLRRNKKKTKTTTKLKRIFQDAHDYLLMSKLFSCKYNSEEEKKLQILERIFYSVLLWDWLN